LYQGQSEVGQDTQEVPWMLAWYLWPLSAEQLGLSPALEWFLPRWNNHVPVETESNAIDVRIHTRKLRLVQL